MTRKIIHYPDTAAFRRGVKLASMLAAGKQIDTALIRKLFDVSKATAKRDLADIEQTIATSRITGPNGRTVLVIAQP